MPTEPEHFSLRPATLDDFEQLFNIHRAALGEYIAATWGWDDEWQRDFFQKNFKPEVRSVIEIRGRMIGFVDVTEQDGGIYLENIEIAPLYQGRGIGTRMIQDLLARAYGRGVILKLQVLKVNHRARALYERLGFQRVGDTETHFLMEHRSKTPELANS
ncbi:MAG: GNAT family N-acetyltransferase [Deltaproteobacteria bacterium]|nr:MAG: GNAT family N-acetyltransferase [Deltaproteobacteria bacterium]